MSALSSLLIMIICKTPLGVVCKNMKGENNCNTLKGIQGNKSKLMEACQRENPHQISMLQRTPYNMPLKGVATEES